MAKSKSFFGLRKGSTKTMTYSVLKGQQITKDRVTDIANPRTMDQTLQRIPFAQAVKFYKQMTKGLFRFAFEDKKPLESDYNAFIRHNVKYASSVSLDNYRNSDYPALGNWHVSAGSLGSPVIATDDDSILLSIAQTSSQIETIGELTPIFLETYPSLAEGDIVTFVTYNSQLTAAGTLAAPLAPKIYMDQFVLDSSSEVRLDDIGLSTIAQGATNISIPFIDSTSACVGFVIFSRNTPDGLKVSDSYGVGNTLWNTLLTNNTSSVIRTGNAYSWGAAEKAILQGSLSD